MTLKQREILKTILDDYDARIDQVYYLRGSTTSRETVFVEFTKYNKDGSGLTHKLVFEPDGYPSQTTKVVRK